MSYPTLEQYNEALQFPQNALVDPSLKAGKISTTGLGLPQALCGGFALTYTITTPQKKYAVRCFHKKSKNLEQGYSAVSRKIIQLKSKYFLDFEFQNNGVKVAGGTYPIVKMAWASGETLATFIENNYRNKSNLANLNNSLTALCKFLSVSGVAHGDIQPENIMVANSGSAVQLIDYDGMYVEELKAIGSAELGQRNFQHPGRTEKNWDSTLDRFSFISLNLSLRALQVNPNLWIKTQSDQAAILFRANDFMAPENANVFRDLISINELSQDAKNFIAICKSGIDKVPTLDDFLLKKNIPTATVKVVTTPSPNLVQRYISAYPVLDATNYSACLARVGDVVELIGQIVEVSHNNTRHGKPYIFVNFGHWKGRTTKLNIWSEGLAAIKETPSESWVGKWVSVIGMIDPAYINRKYKYEHLSITINQNNQIKVISSEEASFRLKGSGIASPKNGNILESIKGNSSAKTYKPVSSNSAILQQMKTVSSPSSQHVTSGKSGGANGGSRKYISSSNSSSCFIATATYENIDHENVRFLRLYRDQVLTDFFFGRIFIFLYYKCGRYLAFPINKSKGLRTIMKYLLDLIVKKLTSVYPNLN